jgi:hypothetical protein
MGESQRWPTMEAGSRADETGKRTMPLEQTAPRAISSDLQSLVDAWPRLTDAMRAGILAIARAACGDGHPK